MDCHTAIGRTGQAENLHSLVLDGLLLVCVRHIENLSRTKCRYSIRHLTRTNFRNIPSSIGQGPRCKCCTICRISWHGIRYKAKASQRKDMKKNFKRKLIGTFSASQLVKERDQLGLRVDHVIVLCWWVVSLLKDLGYLTFKRLFGCPLFAGNSGPRLEPAW